MSVMQDLLDVYEKQREDARRYNDVGWVKRFEERSGFERKVLWSWRRRKNGANLATAEAFANTLGYRLVLEKISD